MGKTERREERRREDCFPRPKKKKKTTSSRDTGVSQEGENREKRNRDQTRQKLKQNSPYKSKGQNNFYCTKRNRENPAFLSNRETCNFWLRW